MAKILPYLLNLAGEFRVCSELHKRGVLATVTYGNHKGVDVYAISDRQERALRIEVKTSQRGSFVTSIGQKRWGNPPDFWVLFQIQPGNAGTFRERFFVLTHEEIDRVQKTQNRAFAKKYLARHGKKFDISKGVDNVNIVDVERFEDQWSKITARLKR